SQPTLNITSNSSVCAGQTINISVSGASNYTWSTGSNANNITVTPTTTTTYSVVGTGTAGCGNTASKTITVNALPSLSVNPSSSVICNGQSVLISASGANTYTWNTGLVSNNISVSPTTNTTYVVTGT